MKIFRITPLISISFLFIFLFYSRLSNTTEAFDYTGTAFIPPPYYSTPWVDSVLNSLTVDQKIAQLLMIEVRTDQNQRYYDRIGKLLTDYNIGGVVFFRGGPIRQARLTNHWQSQMQTPFMVAMDAEWGLSMRLDSTISFPRQMTLGAITNERLIYELGLEMGWQCRRMGIHMNFSPVVDVNSNAGNPVINSRSFGECRYNVARKGIAMMVGMHDAGILANAKHFPGHGDTDTDSHHALPLLNHPIEEIDSVHLFPFKHLIQHGLQSVMVAHLSVPELSSKKNVATSLSHKVVTELLQDQMGFNGLIVTDALNMKGVTDYFPSGELELRALMAGNDILLMPENVPAAIKAIRQAIENNTLDLEYLNEKCRKVLYFKQMSGLDKWRPIPINNLISDLNASRVESINQRLAEAAITVIKNDNDLLPLKRLDTLKIAALSIGSARENPFQSMMANYYPIDMYSLDKNHTFQQAQAMYRNLSDYNLVVVSIQNNSMFPGRNYGIPQQTIDFLNELTSRNNVVLNIFANPYSVRSFGEGINNAQSIVIAYQDGKNFEEASAQVIFGALAARGRLPVTASPWYPVYTGINTPGQLRIKYRSPDEAGINQLMLNRVDSIIQDAINKKVFPGCQVAVIKDGTMIYNRSFGYHTYENRTPVKNHDLYDVASLTKTMATTTALMKLVDNGLIDLDANLGKYLPWLDNTNKANMRIREVLAHQARLRSWIPLYLKTLKDGRPDPEIFQPSKSDEFPIKVAERLYLRKDYRDTIFKTIADSELLNRRRYLYSDLGFILFAEIIENLTGRSIDQYLRDEFYAPLGLATTTYNPANVFDKQRIIPTEHDTLFRKQLIHGYVHDPSAALLGGVSGHAGLFSNARDIAVIMQMLMQGGSYGGIQFIQPETVKEFTRTQFAGNRNRRALGFDKPTITPRETSPACESASLQSFGHSGFTGTYAWADPKENLVYVFLSNRVHPDASNRKISQLEIRLKVHQAIYDAIYFQRFITNTRFPIEITK
jgi:beta-N-acetylhexosaminidase